MASPMDVSNVCALQLFNFFNNLFISQVSRHDDCLLPRLFLDRAKPKLAERNKTLICFNLNVISQYSLPRSNIDFGEAIDPGDHAV